MDIIQIIIAAFALLSTGSALGYWIKTKIDAREKEHQWKKQYYLENLKEQRDLLLEFLGKPRSEFNVLHGVGNTWDENWRKQKAENVVDWVQSHRPKFPKSIQENLTTIANLSSAMVSSQSMQKVQTVEGYEAATRCIKRIESYISEIDKKLSDEK